MRWALLIAGVLALILIPFALFEDPMNAFTQQLLAGRATFTLAATLAGLLAADVLLPIPSSVISTAAGVSFGWLPGTLISWTGMTLGGLAAWSIGRTVGRAGLNRWADLQRAEKLAARHGLAAIIIARPIPVLAESTALLAGAIPIAFPKYLAAIALSNAGISLAYAIIGATAADVSSFALAFLGAIILPGIALLIGRLIAAKTPAP